MLLASSTVTLGAQATMQGSSTPPARGLPVQGTTTEGSGKAMAKGALIGALSGALMATAFYYISEEGTRSSGCDPLNCAMPFLSVSGAIAGMFIGREMDAKRRAFAPRSGESIEFGFAEVRVVGSPTYIDVRDTLMAVVTDSGAQLFSAALAPKALRRRAGGLSTLRQVVLMPERGTLVLGTGTALWEANLVAGPATRLADRTTCSWEKGTR